ncbi:hypothetical protein ACOSP7_029713 [Xanthoceras sorbifolium]
MGKREYDHELNLMQEADASSEFDDQVISSGKRTKLVHDMTVSLPQDMVGVIKEMVAIDTHERDLMLPTMSKYLWWSHGFCECCHYPAFVFPTDIFRPKWLDAGLVSVQKLGLEDYQNTTQLPAVVRYVMFKHANRTRYSTAYITSTLMERSRDNPLKKIDEGQDKGRWESYWSNPLKSRVRRVQAFVTELEKVLQEREEFWIFFDGRRVVLYPKFSEEYDDVDRSRLGNQNCERLLRQFREDPESLDLPPEVRTEFSSSSR